MIHHFKPSVTSIQATPIGKPEYVHDAIALLGLAAGTPEVKARDADPHGDRFDVEPDGSVVVHGLENTPIRYGARSDPAQWWLLVDSQGSIWFTTENPYDNPDYVPAQNAR